MDLSLIQGTITGLKVASDIAKGFLEIKSMAEVQGKVIELQSSILSAQSNALAANADQASMADEIRKLRDQLAQLQAWSPGEAEVPAYGSRARHLCIYA